MSKNDIRASTSSNEEKAEDPNELGAKLIKAELVGDDDLVESLKKRLEKARQIAESKKSDQSKESSQRKDKYYHSDNKNNYYQHQNKNKYNQKGHKYDQRAQDLNEQEAKILKRNYKHNDVNDEYDDLAYGSSVIKNIPELICNLITNLRKIFLRRLPKK